MNIIKKIKKWYESEKYLLKMSIADEVKRSLLSEVLAVTSVDGLKKLIKGAEKLREENGYNDYSILANLLLDINKLNK